MSVPKKSRKCARRKLIRITPSYVPKTLKGVPKLVYEHCEFCGYCPDEHGDDALFCMKDDRPLNGERPCQKCENLLKLVRQYVKMSEDR